MKTFIDLIGSSDYAWIPPVLFTVMVIIAGLIGAWNGWKTATYFFGWNMVALITGVFTIDPIMDLVISKVNMKFDLSTLTPYAAGIIILTLLLAANFLAFCFYWIFRRWLKASMKKNTRLGRSNVISRSVGVSVGIITALPMTIVATNASTFISESNKFTEFNAKLMKGVTFGQYDGYNDADRNAVKGILEIVDDTSLAKNIADIFSGQVNLDDVKPEQVEQIKNALNNEMLLQTITPDFIQDQIKDNGGTAGQPLTAQSVADGLKEYMVKAAQADKDFTNDAVTPENKARTKELINSMLADGQSIDANSWYKIQMALYGVAYDENGQVLNSEPPAPAAPAAGPAAGPAPAPAPTAGGGGTPA